MRVLTLCLNPAVDKTAFVRRVRPGGAHRLDRTLSLPGGKGINVARALRRLGLRPRLLGWTAGETGAWIEREVRRERLAARWVRVPRGESRVCLSVVVRGEPTDFNEVGPAVAAADVARLAAAFARLARGPGLAILSGSLPPGCPASIYARLARLSRRRGLEVLLDAAAPALEAGLAGRPDLAKLNSDEAASLGLAPARGRAALGAILRWGAREAVVTLGPRGAIAFLAGKFLRAEPPRVAAMTPIGCGDTFLAGLAHARLRRWPAERSLGFATALATASALVPGAGLFRRADLAAVLRRTKVGPL